MTTLTADHQATTTTAIDYLKTYLSQFSQSIATPELQHLDPGIFAVTRPMCDLYYQHGVDIKTLLELQGWETEFNYADPDSVFAGVLVSVWIIVPQGRVLLWINGEAFSRSLTLVAEACQDVVQEVKKFRQSRWYRYRLYLRLVITSLFRGKKS